MISRDEFESRIKKMPKTIPSKTSNASYTRFKLHGKLLSFVRVNKGTSWKLNIDELYSVYKAHSFINTTVIKNTTGRRVNSPSVAILMVIDCIDQKGRRIA
jgi:hypothetical protein